MSMVINSKIYYQSKEGKWSGFFVFKINDKKILNSLKIKWFDKCRVKSLAFFTQFGGKAILSTSVDCTKLESENIVLHTTKISKWWVTLYQSNEKVILDPDGLSIKMIGEQRYWPQLGKYSHWEAIGSVSKDYDGATYFFDWYTSELQQKVKAIPDGLEFQQLTSWSNAYFILKRYG